MLGSGTYGSVRLVKRYGFERAIKTTTVKQFPQDNEFAMAALREESCNFEHPHIIQRYWTRWLNGSFQVCMEVATPVESACCTTYVRRSTVCTVTVSFTGMSSLRISSRSTASTS